MPDPQRTPIDPRTGEGGESPVLDRFHLDGRVAIITGASSGLGKGFAKALASAGATVACDVVDPQQCADLVRTAMDEHGRVDVLVNNAGLGTAVPALKEAPEDFRKVVDVNWVARTGWPTRWRRATSPPR